MRTGRPRKPVTACEHSDRLHYSQGLCRSCYGKLQRKNNPLFPKKHRDSTWKRQIQVRYGINETEYLRILETQAGVCAICGTKPTETLRLDVDHNHKTNRIRGLLCRKCNTGIGQFQDDPTLLWNAAVYLERSSNWF